MDFNLAFNPINFSAAASGLESETLYDLLIIGAGPAGLNAALYASRKGLKTGIVGKKRGGQLLNTSLVDNYLGLPEFSGEELCNSFLLHLKKYQVPILDEAEAIDYYGAGNIHYLVLDSGITYRSKTLIVATGSTPRLLGVPGESAYQGKGVSYCTICDAPLYKGKDVLVAGGGNAACEAALDLAKQANSVTLIHRSGLRADQVLIDKLLNHPKITARLRTRVTAVLGQDKMTGVRVEDVATKAEMIIGGEGLFIEIGNIPNSGIFKKHLQLNNRGEIITSDRGETDIPGVFASGDVTDSPYKQIIIAAGGGAIAALAASDYINQTNFNYLGGNADEDVQRGIGTATERNLPGIKG